MKVLAIIGTTRKKGDNYHVTKEIEASMNRIEPVEFKYLYLADIELGFCLGCCACIFQGEVHCPKRKLTGEIEEEMMAADGIILAAPVYCHQVTALMKNFIDHFAYFFHRPRFFDKTAIILSTTGSSGLKGTLNYLRFCATGWGFQVVHSLGVISSAFLKNKNYRHLKLQEINRMSARMLKLLKSKQRPAPSLNELLFFRAMRFKAKNNPLDRQYWDEHGWLKTDYFLPGFINPLNLLLANILEGVMWMMFGHKFKKMTKSNKKYITS